MTRAQTYLTLTYPTSTEEFEFQRIETSEQQEFAKEGKCVLDHVALT